MIHRQQSGAAEACWAHNPEVRRSKLRSATVLHYLAVVEQIFNNVRLFVSSIRSIFLGRFSVSYHFIQLSASSEIVLDLATVSFQDMLVPNGWENKLISFFAVPL